MDAGLDDEVTCPILCAAAVTAAAGDGDVVVAVVALTSAPFSIDLQRQRGGRDLNETKLIGLLHEGQLKRDFSPLLPTQQRWRVLTHRGAVQWRVLTHGDATAKRIKKKEKKSKLFIPRKRKSEVGEISSWNSVSTT